MFLKPVRGTSGVFNVSAKRITYRIIYELLSCINVYTIVYPSLSEVAQFYRLIIVDYDVAAFDWQLYVIL